MKKEWVVSQEKDQTFVYDFPVGLNRLVTIDGNTTRSLVMETQTIEMGVRSQWTRSTSEDGNRLKPSSLRCTERND